MKIKTKSRLIVLASAFLILFFICIFSAASASTIPVSNSAGSDTLTKQDYIIASTSDTYSQSYIFVTKWGSYGSANALFKNPSDVAVDSSGNIYVSDTLNNRTQKFDSNGTFITKWGSSGSEDGQFYNPGSIDVDSSGNVYVADLANQRIQKFDSNGTFITKWGSSGSEDGQFILASGITVDSSENVYVVDTSNRRVQKFDSNGTFITKWGSNGSEDGQFYNPEAIAVDSSGNVYVADLGNQRIQKFDSNGTFITKWGSHGNAEGQFSYPYGIAVDSWGNVYVADSANQRIQKFDSNGAFITKWGSHGIAEGQFSYPYGITVDSSGNVYVADLYNSRIQKFSRDKITPTINWSKPDDITYESELGPDQFNAIAADPNTGNSVPGTFVYKPTEGIVLDVGTHTLHVDFVPANTEAYNTVSAEVQINVIKATPAITWNTPADITYGTALSSTHLSASASVPGIFTYTPGNGTILSEGTKTLHVDFTPTDTANYSNASKDVTINIIAPPVINSIAVPIGPVQVNTSITASASVTYLGDLNSLTAEWNLGDGSTSLQTQVTSNLEVSHVYKTPGIYTVSLTVKDAAEGSISQTATDYIVVYDPNGGFVTGRGWINSPAGAYVADNSLEGKASFGFVSKYGKDATVPTGKTEFQFKVADLNFKSTSYDWLVVSGPQAKYKGTGTINGEGNYGFMLNAFDGTIKGDGIDKFRIKIWDKENENTIYDNEIGTAEDTEPSTAISGGSIIIHK